MSPTGGTATLRSSAQASVLAIMKFVACGRSPELPTDGVGRIRYLRTPCSIRGRRSEARRPSHGDHGGLRDELVGEVESTRSHCQRRRHAEPAYPPAPRSAVNSAGTTAASSACRIGHFYEGPTCSAVIARTRRPPHGVLIVGDGARVAQEPGNLAGNRRSVHSQGAPARSNATWAPTSLSRACRFLSARWCPRSGHWNRWRARQGDRLVGTGTLRDGA